MKAEASFCAADLDLVAEAVGESVGHPDAHEPREVVRVMPLLLRRG